MKKTANFLFGVLLTTIFSLVVFGQTGGGSGIGSISITSSSGSFQGIKGMPYSAESVRETVQTLADGNKITRIVKSLEYRDGEGRTRREDVTSPSEMSAEFAGRPDFVFVIDPVARYTYFMNPSAKTVQRFKMILPADMPLPAVAPAMRPGYSFKTEPLGSRVIDDFETTGTRRIQTIAPGTIGNEKAIEIISESWYSPILRASLLSINTDPRYGVTTTRLTNIKRDEPDKSLFEIPADFKITEQEQNRTSFVP